MKEETKDIAFNEALDVDTLEAKLKQKEYVFAKEGSSKDDAKVVCCTGFKIIQEISHQYLESTEKIDISMIKDGKEIDNITDKKQDILFSSSMCKRIVGEGWATWSKPPYSEEAKPSILSSEGCFSLTMKLYKSSCIFGFELEPNPSKEIPYTVEFYSKGKLVGTIYKVINGRAGARLMAARTTNEELFDTVVITGGADFAIAQIRYSTNKCKSRGGKTMNIEYGKCEDYKCVPVNIGEIKDNGKFLIVDVKVKACEKREVAVGVVVYDEKGKPVRFKVIEDCMPEGEHGKCTEKIFRFKFIFKSDLCDLMKLRIKAYADYSSFKFECPKDCE